jgi:hypothetical protein
MITSHCLRVALIVLCWKSKAELKVSHGDFVSKLCNPWVVGHGTRSKDLDNKDTLVVAQCVGSSSLDLFKDSTKLNGSLEAVVVGWSTAEGCWH